MNLNFRLGVSDVNSDYINSKVAEFKQKRPLGLSIIQWAENVNENVENEINIVRNMPYIQLIIVSRCGTVDSMVQTESSSNIIYVESIEQAKLYVEYSHYIIIDGKQTISMSHSEFNNWQHTDIILCRLINANSVDGQIYQSFFETFDAEKDIDSLDFFNKVIRENVLLLPTITLFTHTYDKNLPFRVNIWLQQLFALVSHTGEVKKEKTIKVDGLPVRMHEVRYKDTVRILKSIDSKLGQRYDGPAIDVLEYFNRQFTQLLKMEVDKGNVDKFEILSSLERHAIRHINHSTLNKGDAKKLVLAYCFPPYNDTSGNVMAKRIQSDGTLVDVISNSMDRIRKKDDKLLNLVSHLIDTQTMLNGPQAFSSWTSIERYMDDGFKSYEKHRNKYAELYSRAMFPHSHFLGFRVKQDNPDLKWTAEFSDPLHKDVKAELRYAPVEDDAFLDQLYSILDKEYHALINDNVFNLCEVLPFIYADEIIFTNRLQMKYMLERFDHAFQMMVRQKAVISQHPTPERPFYSLVQSYYRLDETHINLAYFGNFYDTRGFRQIELVAQQLYNHNINNFTIHVFTNINRKTMAIYQNSEFNHYIRMNPYVSYFEFLNLSDKMDILMIFDAQTVGIKPFNPYVPSKLSDYRGSDSLVWAFTEPGSILDDTFDESIQITRQLEYHKYAADFTKMSHRLKKDLYRVSRIECVTK